MFKLYVIAMLEGIVAAGSGWLLQQPMSRKEIKCLCSICPRRIAATARS
jgi:hypothetical protein